MKLHRREMCQRPECHFNVSQDWERSRRVPEDSRCQRANWSVPRLIPMMAFAHILFRWWPLITSYSHDGLWSHFILTYTSVFLLFEKLREITSQATLKSPLRFVQSFDCSTFPWNHKQHFPWNPLNLIIWSLVSLDVKRLYLRHVNPFRVKID